MRTDVTYSFQSSVDIIEFLTVITSESIFLLRSPTESSHSFYIYKRQNYNFKYNCDVSGVKIYIYIHTPQVLPRYKADIPVQGFFQHTVFLLSFLQ